MPSKQGLYSPAHEKDACGVGFIAHIQGQKSHHIVQQGLQILKNLTHRGATGYDPALGDGAGILIQIPDTFFREALSQNGITLPAADQFACGMVFMPQSTTQQQVCEKIIAEAVAEEGQQLLGWRDVPRNNSQIAQAARQAEPVVRQFFVARSANITRPKDFERKLFVIRKLIEHRVEALSLQDPAAFYVSSLSSQTIIYKGMLLASEIGTYYQDLMDPRVVSACALVHQRFSTNTFPTWSLAQPFRALAHNGEINTIRGNINWIKARAAALQSTELGDDLAKLWPLIDETQSDSASFDNALELLLAAGYSLPQAMMLLVPEAWSENKAMDAERQAFYEFHAPYMEPWDGPAAMAFTDGTIIGATLDRNGLRPARYLVTEDGYVMMASEMGVLTFPNENIVKKWRLQPGKMFLIDMQQGRIIDDAEIKRDLAQQHPYARWIQENYYALESLPAATRPASPVNDLFRLQQAFGYTQEDIKFILQPMATDGEEAIGSMGNDAALPVLSDRNKPLYHYFKQLFAQVTNPPIDPIREALVMSLVTYIGPKPNLLDLENKTPHACLKAQQPILSLEALEQLKAVAEPTQNRFRSVVVTMTHPVAQEMDTAINALCQQAENAIQQGFNIVILSDRDIAADRMAIPALLACAAVHHHLIRKGLRTQLGLVIDTGSAREVHHCALLSGYGAEAICPWLALMTLDSLPLPPDTPAHKNFIKAVNKGIYKVMSKMGVSTYQSYCGAQIFDAIGLNSAFIERYFPGTASNIGGIGLETVEQEARNLHQQAWGNATADNTLDAGGEYAFRVRGEEHLWTPESIAKLQHATRTGNTQTYREYAELINNQSRRHLTLRGLFNIRPAAQPLALDEVEPASEIVKRFTTGAMSLGSISTEAHTVLAIAMNRIGGKSNTGEGGEDQVRYQAITEDTTLARLIGAHNVVADIPLKAGDSMRSRIKQVASGRFGVTAEYLASADQIQIKIAQGAKPGEGGQLPGRKVSEYIAKLRFSVPGVGLISPPPHHDIYSIEDLAQLIHDLKNANPNASISTKLVAETGVGTVAAGVAKAKSDHIVISGHDGGTGASPISSIKHAGSPWEIGLAETQQTLLLNRLRGRVRIQVDGQLKTGRDVLIGALLGADEFGFATAPLVTEGCIMMRKCHLNTCPVGVATQNPELRKKFRGQPEYVINYFFFVAEEIRGYMAQLGVKHFNDLVGRTDLLETQEGIDHWKAKGLDFSKIFHRPNMGADVAQYHCETQNHALERALDHELIQQAQAALRSRTPCKISLAIVNTNRTVGTMLSHAVATRYGNDGLPENTIEVTFNGIAGQSFGAFLAHGITFVLNGEGNDYVGKGLCGGIIVVKTPPAFRGVPEENIIVGNTVMYGATQGEGYFMGVAGERFCVRNSGASAVVEGTGDHGCEYMTGGTVVIIGKTGRNFAAGMSGGVAYVLDEDGLFHTRCNLNMVDLEALDSDKDAIAQGVRHLNQSDEVTLTQLLANYARYTGSAKAKAILEQWPNYKARFVKVMPHEYRRALLELAKSASLEVA